MHEQSKVVHFCVSKIGGLLMESDEDHFEKHALSVLYLRKISQKLLTFLRCTFFAKIIINILIIVEIYW